MVNKMPKKNKELTFLASMGMGEASEWITENQHDYVLMEKEATEELEKELDKMSKYERECRVVGDQIVFVNNFNTVLYYIPKDDCKTHKNILIWVAHLCCKSWVTTELIQMFISLAAIENSISLDGYEERFRVFSTKK
jgi:hypothetical protein